MLMSTRESAGNDTALNSACRTTSREPASAHDGPPRALLSLVFLSIRDVTLGNV